MVASSLAAGSRRAQLALDLRSAASLIELLVVLFIIGIMLSLLLPALGSARAKAQASMCQNNLHQVDVALRFTLESRKTFFAPNRWSVDILRWIEEAPLAMAMKGNTNPNADFPRPPVYYCPMQADFSSRVDSVGYCHFVLVVDRPIRGRPEKVRWDIHDRELLADDEPQEPWYIAPEISFDGQRSLFADKPGPHPGGLYMTRNGLQPR